MQNGLVLKWWLGLCSEVILLPIWTGLLNKYEGWDGMIFFQDPQVQDLEHKTWTEMDSLWVAGRQTLSFVWHSLTMRRVGKRNVPFCLLIKMPYIQLHSNLKGRLSLFVMMEESFTASDTTYRLRLNSPTTGFSPNHAMLQAGCGNSGGLPWVDVINPFPWHWTP